MEKAERLRRCVNENGIIAAIALDARGSLKTALDEVNGGDHSPEQLSEFKVAVTRALSEHASALLLDVIYGLEAANKRADGSGLLLAYESSTAKKGVPTLAAGWSVRRLAEAGACGVKLHVSCLYVHTYRFMVYLNLYMFADLL